MPSLLCFARRALRRQAAPRPAPLLLAPLLLAAHTAAPALEVTLRDPDFTITVPNLADIPVRAQPASAARSAPRAVGESATHKIEVFVTTTGNPVSSRECAGSGLRAILAQPGMPDRDNVYRAPLSEKTFLVLYVLGDRRPAVLHAHLLSAVAGSHCAQVHFSHPRQPDEDQDDWRKAFSGARIDDATR